MLEVEVKAALDGMKPDRIRAALSAVGFKRGKTVLERDTYFTGIDRDFQRTDEALRVRRTEDLRNGSHTSAITYKGKRLDTHSKTREECETAIEDPVAMTGILKRLGFSPVFTVEKTRQYFHRGDCKVNACLDEVRELGLFLELEQLVSGDSAAEREAAASRLLSCIDALDIDRRHLTRSSYLEMLLHQQETS